MHYWWRWRPGRLRKGVITVKESRWWQLMSYILKVEPVWVFRKSSDPESSWMLLLWWCWAKPINGKHLRFLLWLNSYSCLMSFPSSEQQRPLSALDIPPLGCVCVFVCVLGVRLVNCRLIICIVMTMVRANWWSYIMIYLKDVHILLLQVNCRIMSFYVVLLLCANVVT